MNRYVTVPALAFLVACGGFEPAEGEWELDDSVIVEDGCALFEDDDEPDAEDAVVQLTLTDDGFTFGDIETVFDCELRGKKFECASLNETEPQDGMDAEFSLTLTFEGTFQSAESFSGEMSYAFGCEGADCDTLAGMVGLSLPCTTTLTVEGSFTGANDDE